MEAVMALVDLAEGDIIVQSGADHCVMWVGGDQPLAHAVTGPGVIQQSDGYFRDVGRPVTLGDHTVWRLTVQSDGRKHAGHGPTLYESGLPSTRRLNSIVSLHRYRRTRKEVW
jgi:hypothetical protein